MRRVAVLSAVVGGALVLLGVTLAATVGPAALTRGRAAYAYRGLLAKAEQPDPPGRPLVTWLGDSTLLRGVKARSWAEIVAERVLTPAAVTSRIVAWVGLGPYHFYCLMGPVVRARPSVVVVVANLRMFGGRGLPFADLCGALPGSELPHAIVLPFVERGVTMPQLLLYRTLAVDAVSRGVFLLDGLRAGTQDASLWGALGPERTPELMEAQERLRPIAEASLLGEYDTPLAQRRDAMRMLAAALRLARTAGVEVVVVASPVPRDVLVEHGLYDPERYAERMLALRQLVEAGGGTFLDLHDAVARSGFSDDWGHFDADGAERVASLVAPVVAAKLGIARP